MGTTGERRSVDARRGRLKVFLGAAAGVGKTYGMLGQARDLRDAGVDVVVGYLEAHGRRATEARAEGLEVAPRRTTLRGGRSYTDMDTAWLLERAPQVCLVDELAHTNLPGGRHDRRWQDVEELLSAGIDVYTTVNIQHLESLNDRIHALTGVRVRETFPDRLLHDAAEVVLVDLPAEALRERIAAGVVYPAERVRVALDNFFTVENLIGLRALALREVAEQEEAHLDVAAPPVRHDPDEGVPMFSRPRAEERILVCVDGRPASTGLVRRAARLARRVGGRLYVLHVEPGDQRESDGVHATVERAEWVGRQLGGTVLRRAGDTAEIVVDVVREVGATQVVLGESHRPRWRELLGRSIIARVLRETDGVDLLIVADERARLDAPLPDPG